MDSSASNRDPATPDSFLTPVDSVFTRSHLGPAPDIDIRSWTLTVDGLTYLKDLPLQQAHDEVVLAHTVNGEPLLARHGLPAARCA
ncbi:molybdopterin-dependent oxidoreductase [Streptomyces sp. NPDC048506]|uniref:molybdopterin-dependent oxidoreductase n=1 Tax=Streptomyces sp. NPDC048506 TaxID=3155028 RepID=UPI00342755AD